MTLEQRVYLSGLLVLTVDPDLAKDPNHTHGSWSVFQQTTVKGQMQPDVRICGECGYEELIVS